MGNTGIDQRAIDSLSVAPGEKADAKPEAGDQHAGQDEAIAKRLERNPEDKDAQLDNALDESMDASDPPANTQPGSGEPAPSSGFDAAEEAERQRDA